MGVGALEAPSSERKRLAALYASPRTLSLFLSLISLRNANVQGREIGFAHVATGQI
jgi:hypothetical protein